MLLFVLQFGAKGFVCQVDQRAQPSVQDFE
jgi:hypothetical protein